MAAFKLNIADLVFVLKQIKIAEAHSSGTPLTEIWVDANGNVVPAGTPGATLAIPSPMAPFGLRTVDGSFNNIVDGRETWGAADQVMPRLLPSYYRNDADGDSMPLGPPGSGAPTITNNNYGANGSVADADPRLISNLVADMSFNNPAAIVAALSYSEFYGTFAGEIYGAGGALETIQTAWAQLRAVLDNNPTAEQAEAANAAFDAVLVPFGVEHNGASISIPNIAPDEGLSVPFNAWMTFFGQFFDHGLDLINKGGNGTVYVPLQADDPLMTHGADGIAGTGDELSLPQNSHLAFMAVTRATPSGESEVNQTTPFVDQNQTYTSNASHQAFLREYVLAGGRPVATGHLLDGRDSNETVGSLPTWADVKAQALAMLGIQLTDLDVGNIPVLRMDPYGEFVRGPNGMPQILAGIRSDGTSIWVETSLANPINPSAIQLPVGTTLMGGNVITAGETVSAVRTGHAFLDDIAHNAVPVVSGGVLVADADTNVGNAVAFNPTTGRNLEYDNELLDQHYITGDGRGNENIGLTTVHHIFHSEHNRQVEQQKLTILASGDEAFINEWLAVDVDFTPAQIANMQTLSLQALTAIADTLTWDGERLFQAARMATEMQYQHLVFEEFARKIQPAIDPFVFNSTPDINPAIFAEFAHVVYRFGHSMLTDNMPRLNGQGLEIPAMKADGTPMTAEEFGLVASFLNPTAFDNNGSLTDDEGAAAIIRGMTIERGNEIDEFLVDALRNNLLGLPLDLAAINIARGRDTGMPSLNQARQALFDASGSTFLEPYKNWVDFAGNLKNPVSVVNFIAAYGTHSSITSATTAEAKRDAAWLLVFGGDGAPLDRMDFLNATGAYTNKGGLNEIDLWIGGLAEKKMPFGGFLGSTFNAVFELQLENLQDGDRFYYLTRTQGQNFLVSLEQNSFAKMMMANTTLAQPGADGIRGTPDDIIDRHIGVDSFGVYDYVLEVNVANQTDYTPVTAAELAAANAAVAAAQTAHDDAVAASNAADLAAGATNYTIEQAEYVAAQLIADGQDANDELAALMAAASADQGTPDYLANLLAAISTYQSALAADTLATANAATALQEAQAALAADNAAIAAAGAEAAALAALTAAQDALAALIAGGAGKDPVGNNPALEAMGLGKVVRDDPTTAAVETNYIRVQGGEHVVVGGTNGNDTIITDFGDDGIWGDAGDDRIESGAGVDLVNGGAGNDIITDSGDTGDFLKGDEGDDVILGGNGLDIYMGGDGKDVVFHGVDDAETFAGQGDDFVLGGDGVDLIMGNEGDDWLEAGAGFDTTAGDNSELFFDSKIIGHDVMFSGSEEHDFDAESGDDIMVQGESVLRSEGMFGFDWATYKGNPQNADVDLARPIFTTEVQDVLRDRFDKVEAASGFTGDDLLVGDDRTYDANAVNAVNATAEGIFFRDEINMAGINRINGLNQIITENEMIMGIYTSEFGDLKPNAAPELIFGGGNVLIGGAGDDVMIGKGGDDIIDGDKWLNVRIRITQPGQANTAANEIATIDSLKHVFTAQDAANPSWVGKSLAQLLIDRVIVPNQMHIVREILNGNQTGDVDTAVYWDTIDNYEISVGTDGALHIEHVGFNAANIPQALLDQGFRPVSDGRDTVRNVEKFRFGDGQGGFIEYDVDEIVPLPATGQPVISDTTPLQGQTLSASTAGIADPNGISSPFTYQWQFSTNGTTWTNINGATNANFTIGDGLLTAVGPFAGQFLRVQVSFTDGLGGLETVTSNATSPVGINYDALVSLGVNFTGQGGNDVLMGSLLNDVLAGEAGDDYIDGRSGNDTLRGLDGNDTIVGGPGNDSIQGGNGTDTAVYNLPIINYVVTTDGTSIIVNDLGGNQGRDTIIAGMEVLRFGTTDFVLIVDQSAGGTSNINGAAGQAGSQAIFGRWGDDTMFGGDGSDLLIGGAGDDVADGGAGDDYFFQDTAFAGIDTVNGGDGTDTYILTGVAGAETFRIYTATAAAAAGFASPAGTEIVITRDTNTTAETVIARLDNIEEIKINSLVTTANNGNNPNAPDGGASGGDTIQVFGNFTTTSLDYSTITINGSGGNDTVDITGLTSDHRVVFTSNGGADTVVGSVRNQDVFNGITNDQRVDAAPAATSFGAGDGVEALVRGQLRGVMFDHQFEIGEGLVRGVPLRTELGGFGMDSNDLFTQTGLESFSRTMVENWMDDQPLDLVETVAPVAVAHQPVPIDPLGFLKYLSFNHDLLPA